MRGETVLRPTLRPEMEPKMPKRLTLDRGLAKAELLPLSRLHLDLENPRFGNVSSTGLDESVVLDRIVEQHGIKDVLSSLSANGFFNSEPLVGVINKGAYTDEQIVIVEGNRRLAACLVLAGDSRAINQSARTGLYKNSAYSGQPVPVLLYDWSKVEDRKRLLPYLGIRHIVGAQPWDSFAKASWVASVLELQEMSLDEIVEMIGDSNRTVARFLDGFYLVEQVKEAGVYDFSNSARRGRGSNPHFPFSWIYSALGYEKIREFIGFGPAEDGPKKNPVPQERLAESGELMRLLFGDLGAGRSPTLRDTRQLGDLAYALADDEGRRMLLSGAALEAVRERLRPVTDQVKDRLRRSVEEAGEALKLIVEGEVSAAETNAIIDTSNKLRKVAGAIVKTLRDRQDALAEEEDADV